jgi:hypothetical protein
MRAAPPPSERSGESHVETRGLVQFVSARRLRQRTRSSRAGGAGRADQRGRAAGGVAVEVWSGGRAARRCGLSVRSDQGSDVRPDDRSGRSRQARRTAERRAVRAGDAAFWRGELSGGGALQGQRRRVLCAVHGFTRLRQRGEDRQVLAQDSLRRVRRRRALSRAQEAQPALGKPRPLHVARATLVQSVPRDGRGSVACDARAGHDQREVRGAVPGARGDRRALHAQSLP